MPIAIALHAVKPIRHCIVGNKRNLTLKTAENFNALFSNITLFDTLRMNKELPNSAQRIVFKNTNGRLKNIKYIYLDLQ